jgi:dienelactone hydrolase
MNTLYNGEVTIPVDRVSVKGNLYIPAKAKGIVMFSHGSGSSRFSKRNQMVAKYLNGKDFGTLLLDLLTEHEDQNYYNRFDIELLTNRLAAATLWLEQFRPAEKKSIGYFGASTGAASALKAAALLPQINAVVSRGGRPDLALDVLHKVEAPTLLIVGSLDHEVLQLNRKAFAQLKSEKGFEIVEGASHLFEEEGKMEQVCELAGTWFEKYLQPVAAVE